MKTKVCSKCKIDKPHSEYFKDNKRVIGIRCKCKACCHLETIRWREKNRSNYNNYVAMWRAKNSDKQHATEIKRRYGLKKDQYEQMLIDQRNCCKICGKSHEPDKKRGRLYVDHNHATGKVRSLLCGPCNSAIGHLGDSISILEKAIAYLREHQ